MKKRNLFNIALATSMATAAVVAVVPTDAAAATKSFSDLDSTNPHYTGVMKLTERGVISGYPDGTFKPYQSISRAHAAKIIAQALGLDTKNVKDPGFKDIPKSYPYYGEIAALANAGIINGFPDGSYRPNETLSRGQMAKIIANAFKLQGDAANLPFTDVVNSPYKEQIAALYANKVTTGTTATTFSPLAPVTRGQLASFVVRAEEAKVVKPEEPEQPEQPPAGGGGGGGAPSKNYEKELSNAVTQFNNQFNNAFADFGKLQLQEDNNKIEIVVSKDKTLSQALDSLKAQKADVKEFVTKHALYKDVKKVTAEGTFFTKREFNDMSQFFSAFTASFENKMNKLNLQNTELDDFVDLFKDDMKMTVTVEFKNGKTVKYTIEFKNMPV